jgi:ribosome-associated toxin RatA of RatAB toxin-antitoxin module
VKKITRSAIVEHSAALMYRLVEEIEAYPRFLPWCAEAKVLERGAEGTLASLTAALGGLRQSFVTRNASRPGESIEMHLVEGPFRRFEAAWRFQSLAPRASKVEFSLEYEFRSRALGRLLQPLFDRVADTMVDAFTRRADELDPGGADAG